MMKLQAEQQFTVSITPLTPIHIGCGMDYEPTETLIDGRTLYPLQGLADWQGEGRVAFNQDVLAVLTQYSQNNINSDDDASDKIFRDLQSVFKKHADHLKPLAKTTVKLSVATALWSNKRKDKEKNKFKVIERTAFNALTNQAIIPGSALKGAFRTAHLAMLSKDAKAKKININANSKTIERDLLGGDYQNDPLRQLKISDAIPSPFKTVQTAIVARAIRNRSIDMVEKKEEKKKQLPDALNDYAEVIIEKQLYAFTANISIQHLNGLKIKDHQNPTNNPTNKLLEKSLKPLDLSSLIQQINAHTQETILGELNEAKRAVFKDLPLKKWWDKHSTQLEALMAAGAALIRIGKHGGAEHLTLAEHRLIDQPKGKQTQTPITTVLAKDDRGDNFLQPFGFAVLIPQTPEVIKKTCDALLNELLGIQAVKEAMVEPKQAAIDTLKDALDWLNARISLHENNRITKKKNDAYCAELNALKKIIATAIPWELSDKETLAKSIREGLVRYLDGFDPKDKGVGKPELKKILAPLNLPMA